MDMEWICVYVSLSHFAVQHKLTQHCMATMYTSIKFRGKKRKSVSTFKKKKEAKCLVYLRSNCLLWPKLETL